MNKQDIKIKIIIKPVCETCGKSINQNQPVFILYQKIYHSKCGYNN